MVSVLLFVFLPERQNDELPENSRKTASDVEKIRPTNESSIWPRKKTLPLIVVWKTLGNYRKWPHFIGTACVFSTWSPLTTYTPTIMMTLGFTRIEANALAAIGSLLTLPVILGFAYLSDKMRKRGLAVIIAVSAYLVALILLRGIEHRVGRWGKFGLWTVVNGLAVGYHPIHNAWIQMNCETAEERNISVA